MEHVRHLHFQFPLPSCLSWYLFSTALYMNNAIAPSLPLMPAVAPQYVQEPTSPRCIKLSVRCIRMCCRMPTKQASILKAMPKAGIHALYRDMIRENPSTHWPVDPEMPAKLYPRGGIIVCLKMLVRLPQQHRVELTQSHQADFHISQTSAPSS
jgi:hypothetical protein